MVLIFGITVHPYLHTYIIAVPFLYLQASHDTKNRDARVSTHTHTHVDGPTEMPPV